VVVADPEGLVKEFDEDNNSAQKTVIVDLLVPSIDAVYWGECFPLFFGEGERNVLVDE
jgi:subtilase family serine protease